MYPNCMPDIMILAQVILTKLLYYTNCQSPKSEIIQQHIYKILTEVKSGHLHHGHSLYAR